MRSFEKLISFLMALAIMVGCLASCNNKNNGPDDNGNKDDNQQQELQSDKYAANISVTFATNDDKMKDAVYALNSSASTLYVDGDKVMLDSLAELDNISVKDNYVYIDGVIYHGTLVTANGKSASVYEKANMTAENRDKLIADFGTGSDIGVGDFETHDMTGSNGNFTYTCSDINEDAKKSLGDIFASEFSGLGATVQLDDAEYILTTENDRDESYTLSCHFSVTMNGETYTVTMHISCDYNYDAAVNILAPQNADNYTLVSYEEIIK